MKYILALIPIIGASVLLWGAPVTNLVPTWAVQTYSVTNHSNFYRLNLGGKASDYYVFFYTNREVFIVDSRRGPTNVVFSNDYSGTIQIGTNFWRVVHWKVAPVESNNTPDAIEYLITSGQFCAIRGHAWGPHLHVTLEYVPSRIGCRECKVCGLHQSQYASEWK